MTEMFFFPNAIMLSNSFIAFPDLDARKSMWPVLIWSWPDGDELKGGVFFEGGGRLSECKLTVQTPGASHAHMWVGSL